MRLQVALLALSLVAAGALAGSVTVTDSSGQPVKDATVSFIHPKKKVHVTQTTDATGKANLTSRYPGPVLVYCAHPAYCAYRMNRHDPSKPLNIKLRTEPKTGSLVCPDGTGEIPGLSGRLNPILDTSNRTYMYADNIALAGGLQQPVSFQLKAAINAEDRDGNRFAITVIDIIGDTALIEYRKK
jgi:hypothetical protein